MNETTRYILKMAYISSWINLITTHEKDRKNVDALYRQFERSLEALLNTEDFSAPQFFTHNAKSDKEKPIVRKVNLILERMKHFYRDERHFFELGEMLAWCHYHNDLIKKDPDGKHLSKNGNRALKEEVTLFLKKLLENKGFRFKAFIPLLEKKEMSDVINFDAFFVEKKMVSQQRSLNPKEASLYVEQKRSEVDEKENSTLESRQMKQARHGEGAGMWKKESTNASVTTISFVSPPPQPYLLTSHFFKAHEKRCSLYLTFDEHYTESEKRCVQETFYDVIQYLSNIVYTCNTVVNGTLIAEYFGRVIFEDVFRRLQFIYRALTDMVNPIEIGQLIYKKIDKRSEPIVLSPSFFLIASEERIYVIVGQLINWMCKTKANEKLPLETVNQSIDFLKRVCARYYLTLGGELILKTDKKDDSLSEKRLDRLTAWPSE